MERRKYKGGSVRLKNFDYGCTGDYFITMCVLNRYHFFGQIANQQMNLSKEGQIALKIWNEIPFQFPFVKTGAFIVMPDHIHGIITIVEQQEKISHENNSGGICGTKNPMLNLNVSRILQWYKGRCSFEIRKINANFKWQRKFHDHIIRNEESYNRISEYIRLNPSKWNKKK